MRLPLRDRAACRWDVVSLGEVMLRFDPGDKRIAQARSFEVWEGGGEYNVARGLSRCFRQRATVVTSLVTNPIGSLIESLILQGGVDASHIQWREHDGIGAEARNGIYFLERGFGLRSALGCMDRGHTAISQLAAGDIDWDKIFGDEGARWFHTGGVFCGLSKSTPAVALEAMSAARRHGTIVSFDCNYRPSLWKARGGRQAAADVNRELAQYVDVLFGHEGDLATELGDTSYGAPDHDLRSYQAMAQRVVSAHPKLQVVATTTRRVASASRNDYGAFAYADKKTYEAHQLSELEVFDRVGSGDSFAAGLIYGLLEHKDLEWALHCGVAHGALAMTTPGDGSYATLAEVERVMSRGSAGVER